MEMMATTKKKRKTVKAAKRMSRSVSGRFVVVDRYGGLKSRTTPTITDVLRDQIALVDRAIQHADQATGRIRGSTAVVASRKGDPIRAALFRNLNSVFVPK